MQNIVCFLPSLNGLRFHKYAWGLYKTAQKLCHPEKIGALVAVVIHTGISEKVLHELPFDEVHHVQVGADDWQLADVQLEIAEEVLQRLQMAKATYLFVSTPFYQEIAVRLSMRLPDAGIVTNVLEMKNGKTDDGWLVKRSVFQDKAHEWLDFRGAQHQFITMLPEVLYGEERKGAAGKVEQIPFLSPGRRRAIAYLGEFTLGANDVKLTEARCVIGIGRGVQGGGPAAFEAISRLADLLNAPIGGSKVADELGLIPRDKRIGSSGQAIEADIYIAIGISGSSQHLAGIAGVKHVIAINWDSAAPIFSRCDLGIVGDCKDAVKLLVDALERKEGE